MEAFGFWVICVGFVLVKFLKSTSGQTVSKSATDAFLKKMGW